jgi:MoxR-like ATPase
MPTNQIERAAIKLWKLVDAALAHCTRVLLTGPPATGKSYAAMRAALGDRTCYRLPLTEETPAAELRGFYVPRGNVFEWSDGPAIRSWREGARLVIDEIDRASGDALTFLYALADDPESARLTLPSGETVTPARGFQLVATTNQSPSAIPEALRSRFAVTIACDYPHPDAFTGIPAKLQALARDTSAQADPDSRIDLRTWREFARLCTLLPEADAGAICFGARYAEINTAIALAGKIGK